MKRVSWGTLLTLGLAVVGFGVVGRVAAELMVHPGDGLAGGATVALAALAGATAGLILGILLSGRLTMPVLTRTAVLAGLAAAGVVGALAWQKAARQAERRARDSAPRPGIGADGKPIMPPLPAPGTPDSLLGLVTVAAESLSRFETREHAYEESSVAVYRQEGNWYLVGVPGGGRAWLYTRSTGRYFPLAGLLANRLNWLTEAWDTRLRDAPDPTAPATEAPVPRAGGQEVPAAVLEARTVEGLLWLRVDVLERSPCEGGGTPPVIATGWIPAWGRDGKPAAWFYSRGC